MARGTNQSEEKRTVVPIRVLLLFQYDHDDEGPLRDQIKAFLSQFKSKVSESYDVGGLYRVELQTLEAACNKEQFGDDVPIYARFLEVSPKFDLAFGILFEDKRSASSAGNLWLESGLWLGMRGESTYAGVTHGNVSVPSNMQAWIFPPAASALEAKEQLFKLVSRHIKRITENDDDDRWRERIKWFLPGAKNWEYDELAGCEVEGSYALDMASHFSRNGHFTALAAQFLLILRKIHEAANSLLGSKESHIGGEKHAEKLHNEANRLKDLVQKLGGSWPNGAAGVFARFLGESATSELGNKDLFEKLSHFTQFHQAPFSDRYKGSEWITDGKRNNNKEVDMLTIQADVSTIRRAAEESIDLLNKSLYTQWFAIDSTRRTSFEETLSDRLPADIRKIGKEIKALYTGTQVADAWDRSLDCDLADAGDVL